jgi:hypothetical protein
MYRIALNVAIFFLPHSATRSRQVLSDDERGLNAIDSPKVSSCDATL